MSNFTQELLGLINRNKKLKTLDLKRDWFEVGRTRFVPSNTGVERKDSTLNGPIYNPKIEPYAIRWADIKKGLDTTYDLTSSQDGANVDVKLIGTNGTTDIVKLVAGQNITLSNTGNQITITSTGGGSGGGCQNDNWVIASNSGFFYQSSELSNQQYYIGELGAGWSGSSYDIIHTGNSIRLEDSNCGIINPHNLVVGDIIKLCGTVVLQSSVPPPSPLVLGVELSSFSCSEVTTRLDFETERLTQGAYEIEYLGEGKGITCFELTYTVLSLMPSCDLQFLVGFNVQNNGGIAPITDNDIRFTYTLSVERNC